MLKKLSLKKECIAVLNNVKFENNKNAKAGGADVNAANFQTANFSYLLPQCAEVEF